LALNPTNKHDTALEENNLESITELPTPAMSSGRRHKPYVGPRTVLTPLEDSYGTCQVGSSPQEL